MGTDSRNTSDLPLEYKPAKKKRISYKLGILYLKSFIKQRSKLTFFKKLPFGDL